MMPATKDTPPSSVTPTATSAASNGTIDRSPGAKPENLLAKLSMAQLLGSAIAAVAAAFVGSRLGTVGTLTGAAIGSLVSGSLGIVLAEGLRHTHRGVRSVVRQLPGGRTPSDGTQATSSAQGSARSRSPKHLRRREWLSVAISVPVAVIAIFAISMGVITALEAVRGKALDGGKGTSISHVVKGSGGGHVTPVTSTTPSASSTPSASGQPSASQAPSASTGSGSTASATATSTSSATSPSAEASAPSAAAGGAPGGTTTAQAAATP